MLQVLLSDPKEVASLLAADNVHVFKGPGYGAILSVSPQNTVVQASGSLAQAARKVRSFPRLLILAGG